MGKTNSLLLAFALLGSSVGAWAQTDGTYYLYDSSTGQFLSRGDSWHTRAVLSPAGSPLEWSSSAKTLHFLDINNTSSYLFATSDGYTYTDNTTNNQWEFVSVDGGYKLKNTAKSTYTAKVTPAFTEQYDYAVSQTSSEADVIVWTLLTPEQYKAKLAERVTSFIYKDVIDKAGLNCTTDNFLATLASDSYKSSDVTSSFATSTITQSEWTVGGKHNNETSDPNNWSACEVYQRCGFITRTVTGLPKGIYKVSLNGFERYTWYATCNTNEATGVEYTTSFLRANSSSVGLKSWYSDKTDTSDPDNVSQAQAKFAAGKYPNEVYCYVGDDNKLQISVNYMSAYASGRWVMFNNLKVTYYASTAEFNAALQQAKDAVANTAYSNVKGKELTDLNALITEYGTTPDDLTTAITKLTEATTAFTAAKDAYDALVAENTKAKAFGITEVTITETTTAASAVTSTQELMVKEYNAVKDNYTLSVKLGDWTTEGPVGEMKSQHWDGTSTSSYYEQSSAAYGQSSWDITYTQDVTLPKGEYVFKMTGRHGSNSGALANTMELTVKNGDNVIGTVNDFPVGDTGLGVNKAGATSFDASDAAGFANGGNGRGWQWRYVPFTLSAETTVTFTIHAAATTVNQWCSFCNYTVEAKPSVEASTIVYNQAVEAANTAKTNYPDTKGKELAELTSALSAAKGETVTTIDAATATIKEKTAAYIAANDSWKRYGYATQAATKASVTYTSISNDNTKTASDAVTDANKLFVSALTNANTKVNGYTLGFETGEYAPYNLVAVEAVLANLIDGDAVSADKVAAADGEDLLAAVTDAYSCTANTTEVNAIYDGTLKNAPIQATSDDVVLPGWNANSGRIRQTFQGETSKACLTGADDKTGVFVYPGTYQYGNTAGYTMPLKAGYYRVSAKYCSWEGESNQRFDLSIKKKDGDAVAAKSFGANKANVSSSSALKKAVMDFEIKDAGDYVLSVTVGGNSFMTDFYILKATATAITLDETAAYTPEAAYANVTLKRTLVEGWNGLVLPFDMTVADAKSKFNASDVKAFSGISVDATNGTTLKFEDATSIEAGVPVMIKVNTASTTNEYLIDGVFLPGTALAPKSYTESGVTYSFKGTYANENLTGQTFALIQGSHFYNYDGTETSVSAKTFRAYFLNETPEVSSSKLHGFDIDGILTGITEVKRNANGNADKMFDLQGRSVKNAAKGLYIKNGKKVIVK